MEHAWRVKVLFLNWSDSRYSMILAAWLSWKVGYNLATRYSLVMGMLSCFPCLDFLSRFLSSDSWYDGTLQLAQYVVSTCTSVLQYWTLKEISRNRVHYCIIPRNWWGLRVLLWIQSLVYNINLHNRYNLQWASTRSPMPVLWGYPFYSSRIIHLLVLASCLSRASGAILKRRRDSRRKCPSWLLYTE